MTYTLNPKLGDITLSPVVGLDLETTGLYPWYGDRIDLIQIRREDFESSETYIIEAEKYTSEELKSLMLRLKDIKVVGHNLKFDCNFILHYHQVKLTNIHDTLIADQLINNGRQKELNFTLIDTIKRYLPWAQTIEKEEKKALQKSFTNDVLRKNLVLLPSVRAKQLQYAAEDVEYLIPLYHQQLAEIESFGLKKVYDLEMKVLPVLSKMEVRGALVDREGWLQMIKTQWEPELKEIEKKLDGESIRILSGSSTSGRKLVLHSGNGSKETLGAADYAHSSEPSFKKDVRFIRASSRSTQGGLFGGDDVVMAYNGSNAINYDSSAQLLELWADFGEPCPRNSKGEPSVDEGTITTYLTENPGTRLGTFIEILLEYRELSKLLGTYGESFLAKLDKNNRIHTEYNQCRTETGRLNSKNPNLQNIPSSKKANRNIRQFFISDVGYKMVTCDMAAAEVRIAADYSGEPLLLAAIIEGKDMHSELSSGSFSIILGRTVIITNDKTEIDGYISEELRTDHKRVVFAKFYKGGAKRIYAVLAKYINKYFNADERLGVAKRISDTIDARMPVLSAYLSGLITKAQKDGKLLGSKLGRIRYFKPDVYGEAANLPIQCTNAEAQKIAMINIDAYFERTGYGYLVNNVHDETVSEVKEDIATEAAETIKQLTSDALSWFLTKIKGGASVSVDTKWKK